MVIVKLQGGLGNQMFQYAAARGASGSKGKVILDLTFLSSNTLTTETFTPRNYELSLFKNLKATIANPFLNKALFDKRLSYKI